MRIVACLKAAPQFVTKVAVAPGGHRVTYEAGPISLSEGDETALEQALVIKGQSGGEVVALTAGTLSAQQALYRALAKGADRAVRVDCDVQQPAATAVVLSAAVNKLGCQVVLTGMESFDNMAGQVGGTLAARLGNAFACGVTEVRPGERASTVRVITELGEGFRQLAELRLPAVLAVQPGALPLSQVSIRRLMQARAQCVECLSLADLGLTASDIEGAGCYKVLGLVPPRRTRRGETIAGGPAEVAGAVVGKIAEAVG